MRLRNRENSPYVVRSLCWRRHVSCLDDDICEFGAVQFPRITHHTFMSIPRTSVRGSGESLPKSKSLQITALTTGRLLHQLSVGIAVLIPD